MRILHVVPTYLPARRYGGPIFAVHGLARALSSRGHEVDVFTTNVDGPGTLNVETGVRVDRDGVGVHYFPTRFRRLYWSPQMGDALGRNVASYDVVHLHSVFLWPAFAAASAARKAGRPYVISPRGMLVQELIRQRSRWIKTAWIAAIERRNFRGAAAIHFTSQREWDDARQLALPLPSPFVVPNGIDLDGGPAPSPAQRDPSTILFLGRITWKKGIDRILEALRHVPHARLIIAGNDEENFIPRLEELAQRLGVDKRIEFTGVVEGERKRDLLARCTLFVLPSISENFGNAVLEAMAAAAPVVVTPQVGLADEIARRRTGLVIDGKPANLAEAINGLLADQDRRAEMGMRARRLVEERFTWPRVAEQMEEEYVRISR